MKASIFTVLVLSALISVPSQARIGAMRSNVVADLAEYTAPRNAPAAVDISFMPDGKSYVERSADGRRLVVRDIANGKELETLFDVANARQSNIASFETYSLSPDASRILLCTDSRKVYRRSATAQYYVYEVRSRLLKPLSTEHPRQSVPLFSPDSRVVAFVAEGNIYAAKLDYGTEVAVTTDGQAGKIINGATDWTYEEEFGTTSLMAWAPDNLTLCYVRTDESAVPVYTLPIYAGTCAPDERYEYYPGVLSYKYPVAGQDNARVSVHSYDVETRKTKQIELPAGAGYYIPAIAFGPQASQLMIASLNRDQNHLEILLANPRSTVAKSVYSDESKAWIEPVCYEGLKFGPDGFVVASDADGYTRFYQYSYTGARMREISQPGVDATDYYGADEAGNHYYRAAAPTPLHRTVYRLDAKGKTSVVGTDKGSTTAQYSPGCRYALLTHSSATEVPRTALCRADGKELQVLADNAEYAGRARALAAPKEFIKVPSEDGIELNGYIIKPKDFNAARRYPVIMTQYSGPGSQQVLDRWTLDWEQYAANSGYIVLCVDGRGTGGRGTAFRTSVYKHLGTLETKDQLAAARYAAALPYVDAKRIGMCGWSYGGYQTLMSASADEVPFAAAVAIAPVTDWRFYDTVYTERYMLTPQQNAAGYNAASAIGRALHLACPLLMMYGTADDNVHPANTLQYVSTLQSAGILCDMLVFPQMNHSINGCNARQVVYGRMLEYFNTHLGK